MTALEPQSGVPLYRQLHQALVHRIARGEWSPGDLIPSEKALEEEYGVSRTTIRQALRDLHYDGLISRHRGRGTFVSEPKLQHGPGEQRGLVDTLDRVGVEAGWRLVDAGLGAVGDEAAAALSVESGTLLFRVERLRLAGPEVLGHLVAYVAPGVAVTPDPKTLTTGHSLSYLGSALRGDAYAERVLDAIAAGVEIAERLEVEPGSPVLRIRRTTFAADGTALEVMTAHYRGDRFEYTLSGAPVRQP